MQGDADADARFLRWAEDSGITSSAEPQTFGGGLRGLAAIEDIQPGAVVLAVPAELLINEDTVRQSDLGQALAAIGKLPEDWLLLIFTMVDRHDPESRHAPFWASLPPTFCTGLTAPAEALQLLCGLHAHLEFTQHVASQFEELQPLLAALRKAYPEHIQPSYVDFQSYMWAVELWYAYAMQVEVRPGVLQQSLVPFASLLNHSAAAPHITRFGRLQPGSRALQLRVEHGCRKAEQLFLSYGRLPNWHLLLFYGFAVRENPHDECILDMPANSERIESCTVTLRLGEEPRLAEGSLAPFRRVLRDHVVRLEAALERCKVKKKYGLFGMFVEICLEGQLDICRWHERQAN